MADLVTSVLLNRGAPENSLCGLLSEMLWTIFSHSSLVTLMRLSTACSILRYHVHEYFASCISAQAKQYPEVKHSLSRIGWTEKHNSWDCSCFKMMGGPLFTWSQLEGGRPFSTTRLHDLSKTSTVSGKTFIVTNDDRICYKQFSSGGGQGHNSLQTLTSYDNGVSEVKLASYDNVVAFSLKKYYPQRDQRVSACIFNVRSLEKVCEIELCHDEDDMWVANRGIALTKDTMVVSFDFIYGPYRDMETKIQIWKLNTQDPQSEGIALCSTMSHHNAQLSKKLYFHFIEGLCVNNQFVVVFDVAVKVFGRSEDNPLISQIEIPTGHYVPKVISLQSGHGDHLAVALRTFTADNIPKLTVKVYSASRGDLIIQKELNHDPYHLFAPFYIKWFGHHLIIGCQQDSNATLTFFSWQPELTRFLRSPCRYSVVRRSPRRNGGVAWYLNTVHTEFQSLTMVFYSRRGWFHNRLAHFKTWKSAT